jgi:hypothetical protein
VVVAAASGSGDLERLRRIAKLKKLKETGGDYESFLEVSGAADMFALHIKMCCFGLFPPHAVTS